MIVAFLIFASRQTLDAIMIPTGGYEENAKRTKRAAERYANGGGKILLISGAIEKPVKTSQVYEIEKQLRSYGIKPSQIMVEGKSKSTLDNMLYSLEKLKKIGAKKIGIAAPTSQLDRFESIIHQAKKEGLVDKDFTIYRLRVPEDFKKRIYGTVARLVYDYKLSRGLRYAKEHESSNLLNWIKSHLFK